MKELLEEKIIAHGERLLKIFPDAPEKDPLRLCRSLRRLEREANLFATERCNGVPRDMTEEQEDARITSLLVRARAILGTAGPKIMLNMDCRGYAFKIDSDDMKREWIMDGFHRDWGGNGIIAPDLR